MKEAFAIVAGILALIGNIPYLRDILQKKVTPHAYTWLLWTIVSGIIFFGQVAYPKHLHSSFFYFPLSMGSNTSPKQTRFF